MGTTLRNPTRMGFLWTNSMAFSLIPVSEPSDALQSPVGGIGNDIYGNRIFCFFQPKPNFPSEMEFFLPKITCFLGLPPLVFHDPLELVATVRAEPTTQLSLWR